MTLQEILNEAIAIKEETGKSVNSAIRIGGWMESLAEYLSNLSAGTVGSIEYYVNDAPAGVILADGSEVSRVGIYADLFAAIGTTYGIGDGNTTFNLPDLRGRSLIGSGEGSGLTNRNLGTFGGQEKITNVPEHNHNIKGSSQNDGSDEFMADNFLGKSDGGGFYDSGSNVSNSVMIENAGVSSGVDVMNPYSVVYMGIRFSVVGATNQAANREFIIVPCSDETTQLTQSSSVPLRSFRMPYDIILTNVKASLITGPTGGELVIDVHKSGTSIFSTKLTIDADETSTVTANIPAELITSAIEEDSLIEIFADSFTTTGGNGLKVTLIGDRV